MLSRHTVCTAHLARSFWEVNTLSYYRASISTLESSFHELFVHRRKPRKYIPFVTLFEFLPRVIVLESGLTFVLGGAFTLRSVFILGIQSQIFQRVVRIMATSSPVAVVCVGMAGESVSSVGICFKPRNLGSTYKFWQDRAKPRSCKESTHTYIRNASHHMWLI